MSTSQFKTNHISVFKNGLGFIQKSGRIEIANKVATIQNFPDGTPRNPENYHIKPIVLGTLWMNSENNPITHISRVVESISKNLPTDSMHELLEANNGKPARFFFRNFPEPIESGEWEALDHIVILKRGAQWISAKISEVDRVEFSEKPQTTLSEKESNIAVKIHFERDESAANVDLMYVQKGITWTPNYYIEIDGKENANLRLRAVVLNDIQDFENVHLDLVVGVPNFAFEQVDSPINMKYGVEDFVRYISNPQNPSFSPKAYMTAQSFRNTMHETEGLLNFESEEGDRSQRGENLFFYPLENITLGKDETGQFPILETATTYKQFFTCTLPAIAPSGRKENYPVWSTLQIRNNTRQPFTTGTAFVVRKESGKITPVSETMLSFTPAGLNAQIKTTQAPDISIVWQEEETHRGRSNHKDYNLVEMKGTIEIVNLKDKVIDLVVDKPVTGQLNKSDAEWETTTRRPSAGSLDKENQVKWRLEIPSGGRKVITFTYSMHSKK